MSTKQAILAALNKEITRSQLMDICGIIEHDGKYKFKRKEKTKKAFVPPSIEELIIFFKSNGYNDIGAKKAYDYYSVAGWKDSTGKQVINWKQKMIGNWFLDEYKIKEKQVGQYQSLNDL